MVIPDNDLLLKVESKQNIRLNGKIFAIHTFIKDKNN